MNDVRRPRLLFLCRQLPWPLHGGAALRNYWLLAALAARYDVDLFAPGADPRPHPALAALCRRVRTFPPPRSAGRARRLLEGARPGTPYLLAGQIPPAMARAVARAVDAGTYDAIHLAELPTAPALPPGPLPPLVYDAHNCEHELLRRRARTERLLPRIALRMEAERVRRAERALVGRAALVTAPSAQDVAELARLRPDAAARAAVVPNGVDAAGHAACAEAAPEPGTVLVPGSMTWRPNRQGLEWFLAHVLPLLDSDGALRVRVAGRIPPALADRLRRIPRVTVIPNPADMRAELARAEMVAVPLLASSGTRLRILEAWAAGRPVVTTPAGALGLPSAAGVPALLAAASPAEFADAVRTLAKDAPLRGRLREAGLRMAAEHDWSRVGAALLAAYETVPGVGEPRAGRAPAGVAACAS